jgi:hypothetical protein
LKIKDFFRLSLKFKHFSRTLPVLYPAFVDMMEFSIDVLHLELVDKEGLERQKLLEVLGKEQLVAVL